MYFAFAGWRRHNDGYLCGSRGVSSSILERVESGAMLLTVRSAASFFGVRSYVTSLQSLVPLPVTRFGVVPGVTILFLRGFSAVPLGSSLLYPK